MANDYLFTSESVSEGHPDKVADQISDRILDAFLARDPSARVACETLLADQYVVAAGEFKTRDEAVFRDIEAVAESIVRKTLSDIGYTDAATGIDPRRSEIRIAFNRQSSEIGQGVDRADGELGAGDQGLMFGYACDETPELMPLAISLAHRLVRRQAELRKSGALPWLRPDAKSQVTVRYKGGRPVAVGKVVLSTQHAESIDTDALRAEVLRHIIDPVVPTELRSPGFEALINPTGRFPVGGPKGDTGLTGRKIIVDTYGGRPDEELENLARERFRLTPRGIIESLGLERPIYAQTASYGHFGRSDLSVPWEEQDSTQAAFTDIDRFTPRT